MRSLFASIAFATSITTAAAQCVVTEPNLSYQQWYGRCASAIVALCGGPAQEIAPGCRAKAAQAAYQTYRQSQYQAPCGPYNAGATMCFSNYVRTCNGTMWMTSSQRC
jgi:hypothetical protein